ncbi:MAG TPA: esterase-like activity of phytase family protein [Allosphingosinicella sp.]|nr:esterase-like activity of phytase family protein [Allosphingosinicella sp.]
MFKSSKVHPDLASPAPASALPRATRIVLALAALPVLTTFAPAALFREPVLPRQAALSFEALPLDPGDPARRNAGGLTYLGGWAVTSNDPRFGGISAMAVQGADVIAVSDSGSLIEFRLPGFGPPRLRIRPLPAGPGPAGSKLDRDAETLVVHGKRAWISFEGHNSVWRYGLPGWRGESNAEPSAMRRWPSNQASEAIVRLRDGTFLIFAENRRRRDGSTEVAHFDGDPALPATRTASLGYRAPAGYRITDAALLPDGRVLFVNRRFRWLAGFSVKLTLADLPGLSAGSVLAGEEIAHLAPPMTIDNMEAVSVTSESGRTILWLASDDNFNGMQRTLLLKFALVEGPRS